jgi:hypothetical protein
MSTTSTRRTASTTPAVPATTGARDFDFFLGRWVGRNRRLLRPLTGSQEWAEFASRVDCRPLLEGAGQVDEFRADFGDGIVGASVRTFDPRTNLWSIFWANARFGMLLPPVVGRFEDGVGDFFSDEEYEGRPIRVRYRWSTGDPASPRWEQAFSADGGATWETNWTMEFRRDA